MVIRTNDCVSDIEKESKKITYLVRRKLELDCCELSEKEKTNKKHVKTKQNNIHSIPGSKVFKIPLYL